jgi:hypothetical protein
MIYCALNGTLVHKNMMTAVRHYLVLASSRRPVPNELVVHTSNTTMCVNEKHDEVWIPT